MANTIKNIHSLTVLRGLAALIVVFYHSKFVFWCGGSVYTRDIGLHSFTDYLIFSVDMLSSCGKQCVILFFILSAFVIKHSYINSKYTIITFYKFRLIRIYIPFVFSIIFSIFALVISVKYINPHILDASFRDYNVRLSNAYHNQSWVSIIKTLFFIPDENEYSGFNFAYWSLLHEAFFYLLFPLYFYLKSSYKIALSGVFIVGYLLTGSDLLYYQLFFIAGLFLFDYFSNNSDRPIIKNKSIYISILFGMYIILNLTIKTIGDLGADIFTVIISFFAFDFVINHVKSPLTILKQLGDISYTLYLNHLPVLILCYASITAITDKLFFYNRLPYYIASLVALLTCIPIYYLAERPSLKLLRNLKHKI